MAGSTAHKSVWRLVREQHGVVTRAQLVALGFSAAAIDHRVARGRLHPLYRGVYAVGRPEVTRGGRWMAAVLACGPDAALSHWDGAAHWGIWRGRPGPVHISVPHGRHPRQSGIVVHRRAEFELTTRDGIPVTTPACTLVDIAPDLEEPQLERAINEADRLDLIDPEALRGELDRIPGRRGVPAVRRILDRRTFTLTDSELERRFLRVVRRAGLPEPRTGAHLNGFQVDFYWPELRLVVETDGLRYHRTPAQQARDRLRDQVHTAAGLKQLRFTHAQVVFEARRVESVLRRVR